MRKEYTIKELQAILGCSRTAIVKKIKTDANDTSVKRYKERYDVTQKDGQIAIIFDDAELEEEKRLSKGFNTVSNNSVNTVENENIIDIEPEIKKNNQDDLLEFTKRYIERYTTLQENMYNELKERDKQILLLTTSENSKEQEYLKTVAENKTLKQRNTLLMVISGVAVTVLICVITFCISYMILSKNVTNSDTVSDTVTVESDTVQEQPIIKEITPEPPKPAQKQVRKR